MRLVWGSNGQLKFKNDREYYKSLGIFANPKLTSIRWEENTQTGSYADAYRLRVHAATKTAKLPNAIKNALRDDGRINCNPYVLNLLENHGFAMSGNTIVASYEDVINTIPNSETENIVAFIEGYNLLENKRDSNKKITYQTECIDVSATLLSVKGLPKGEKKVEKKSHPTGKRDYIQKALDDFVVNNPTLSKYTYVNLQGSLFDGFDTTPVCTINWASSQQVVKIAKDLGFNTEVKDKKTGEDKDSVLEKHLKVQKGINDEFLKLYFDFQEAFKVITSFGEGHLNAINPKTDRIHTNYKQLGARSGRMSCGSQQPNYDLAKYKHLSPKDCTYPNMQQLPADAPTRGAFTAPEGYKWISCDYSALESRLGADIYNETSMLNEFLHGSGDMHSLCAYMVYHNEIPRDTPIKDIKKLYPQLRKAVKGIELDCEDSL